MNNSLYISLLLLIALVLSSCGASKNISIESNNLNEAIYIIPHDTDNPTFLYYNSFKASLNTDKSLAFNIPITIQCDDGSNDELITLQPNLTRITTSEDSATYYIFSLFQVSKSNKLNLNSLVFNKELKKMNLLPISNLTNSDLLLIPNYEDKSFRNEESVFELYALRVKEIIADARPRYFPSSEQLRIEIISPKGAMVWNSNNEMNYMAVVRDLLPKEVGEMHKYTYQWKGLGNNRKKIERNSYNVRFVLPVSPVPYFINSEIFLD